MKNKILVVYFVMLVLLGSVFGSATNLNNESDQTDINTGSIENEAVLQEGTPLFSGGNPLGGGWHSEEELNKHANQYYQKTDDWTTWSTHGMHCDNYWDTSDNDYLYFQFTIDDLPVKELSLKIGVEFKADGWPWNGGPDLDVKNQDTNQWYKREQSMGKPSSLTWKWYAMTNSDKYITSSGVVQFRILCAAGCHAWVDDVGIKYMSADEEIWEAVAYTRDDNGDGSPDGVDIYIDVDVGDYGDGTTVDVTADGELIDPDGDTIDTDSETWTIVDWETEYGVLTLSALGGDNGEYTMEVTIYDENNINEDFADGTINLVPDPQATVTFYCDPSNGGTITFDGSTYNNGQSTTVSYGTYSITANPATYYVFDYWSDDQGCSVSDPNSQSTTVSVTGDGSITANFEYNLYEIDFYTNPTDGGTITFDGDTWSNGQSGNYQPGTYDIEANPANQHYFLDWDYGGDVTVANPNSQSTTATVTGSGWLTANFEEDPTTYRIDFFCNPSFGGYLNFDGTDYQDGDYDNYCQGRYDINAKPNQGYQFYQWIPSPNINVDDIYAKKTKATVNGPGSLTVEFEAIPDLVCSGSLSWTDVKPGETVSGSFDIANEGGPGADLDWEIVDWPSWGTWTFSDYNGNLESGGLITIEVEVVAPNEKESSFDGKVKIVNSDDPDDYCYITAYLATPKNKVINSFPLLSIILQRLLQRFPIFSFIFNQLIN